MLDPALFAKQISDQSSTPTFENYAASSQACVLSCSAPFSSNGQLKS